MKPFMKSRYFDPVILAFFCLLTFGIFIPFLGLYSDDWVFLSVYQKFGHQGLTQYYQTNRPVLGWLFQITMPIFGKSIFAWHLFALLAVFLCSLAVRNLILLLWPKERLLSVIGSVLFIVYPGFTLLPLSITFGHTYFVYLFFLLSTIFLIKAVQNPKSRLGYASLSLIFTAANLFMMEYFFCLTFIQPFFLWFIFREKKQSFIKGILKTVKFYAPWIVIILIAIFWRIFVFKYQTYNYSLTNVSAIKNNFFSGIFTIVSSFLVDIFKTGFLVWFEPIQFITANKSQMNLLVLTITYVIFGGIVAFLTFKSYPKKHNETDQSIKGQGIPIALVFLSLAGWPFWAIGLKVSLNDFNSRFTLPFIIGSVFLVISCLSLIKNRWTIITISSILIGLALGKQFITNNEFHQEYKLLTSYMNQLILRIPGLKPGAFIVSNELPFQHFSYATMSSMIDWFYSPEATSNELDHVLVYSKDPFKELLKNNYSYNNVNFHFSSHIDKSISTAILFNNNDNPVIFNSCLTTIDRNNIDFYSSYIPAQSLEIALHSSNTNIKYEHDGATDGLFNYYFPPRAENSWCQVYQSVSRLQDEGKFKEITSLYSADLKPNYYLEALPFLNAFAQTGDWNSFNNLMKSSFTQEPEEGCLLLERFHEILPSTHNNPFFTDLIQDFKCKK
jgi:hypothetical protein